MERKNHSRRSRRYGSCDGGCKKNKTCRGDFIDIPKTDIEACRTMESAVDHGIISAQKIQHREKKAQNDEIIRAEALRDTHEDLWRRRSMGRIQLLLLCKSPPGTVTRAGTEIYTTMVLSGRQKCFMPMYEKILHDDTQLHVNPWATVKATRRDVLEFAKNIMLYKEKQTHNITQ